MLLYMGAGPAWAAYCAEQRVRDLTACAAACGMLSRRCVDLLGRDFESDSRPGLARAVMPARDCRELCSLTAGLLARESELARFAYEACAEACRRCAERCDALACDDAATQCARLCRRSEEICRRLAGS